MRHRANRSRTSMLLIQGLIEATGFLLIMLLFLIWTLSLEAVIKTTYVRMQVAEVARAERLIQTFSLETLEAFERFAVSESRSEALGFVSDFSDVYEIAPDMRIRRFYKRDPATDPAVGSDMAATDLGRFLGTLPPGAQAISPFLPAQGSRASVYICFVQENEYLIGRLGEYTLKSALDSLAGFSGSLVAVCSDAGDIQVSSYEPLPFTTIPADLGEEIRMFGGTYLVSRKASPIPGSQIVLLTPLTVVEGILRELNSYLPITLMAIVAFFAAKTIVQTRLTVLPLIRFSEVIREWGIDAIDPKDVRGRSILRYGEMETLYKTFVEKSRQVADAFAQVKRNEKEMDALRGFLQSIIDSTPSALVVTDATGVITLCNRAARELAGIGDRTPPGRRIGELFPFLREHAERGRETIETGKEAVYPVENHPGRAGRFIKVSVYPLVHGVGAGLVVRVDDVTELELAQREAVQSQKMEAIGMLASGVAHDFNNILVGFTATLSLLKLMLATGESVDSKELADHVGVMDKAATRAKDVVTRLLTVVRKQVPSLVASDLVKIVEDAVAMCSTTFDRRVQILASFEVEVAPLKADSVHLEQAFLNLAINSLHAMTTMREQGQPQGGVLTVAVGKAHADDGFVAVHAEAGHGADYWTVTMGDSGVGISAESLPRVFDPFFTTKGPSGGSGLGLAIVYNIVHQHGGFLSVSSRLGLGTSVTVYLPVSGEGVPAQPQAEREEPPRGEGTVMVVDDEELVRSLAGRILTRCGYRVILAQDGRQAIELLEKHHGAIDAIVLDINMPEMSGYDVFHLLRASDPEAAILISSGYVRDERVDRLVREGAKGFLQKPYTSQALSRAVHDVVASR